MAIHSNPVFLIGTLRFGKRTLLCKVNRNAIAMMSWNSQPQTRLESLGPIDHGGSEMFRKAKHCQLLPTNCHGEKLVVLGIAPTESLFRQMRKQTARTFAQKPRSFSKSGMMWNGFGLTRAASPVSVGKLAARQSRCSRKRHLSSYAPSGTGNRALAKPGSQNVARNLTHRAVFFHGNVASNCCLGISLRQEPWDAVQDKIWQDIRRNMTRYEYILHPCTFNTSGPSRYQVSSQGFAGWHMPGVNGFPLTQVKHSNDLEISLKKTSFEHFGPRGLSPVMGYQGYQCYHP